jgi:hypothetical protein
VLAHIDRSLGGADGDRWQRESDAILAALGVEWVPAAVPVPA